MDGAVMEDAPANLKIIDGGQRGVPGGRLDHLDMTNLPSPDLGLDTGETGVKPSENDYKSNFEVGDVR